MPAENANVRHAPALAIHRRRLCAAAVACLASLAIDSTSLAQARAFRPVTTIHLGAEQVPSPIPSMAIRQALTSRDDLAVASSQGSLWRDHRSTLLATLFTGLLQFALIVRLLFERRARRRAELQGRRQLAMTAHLERQLAMGELMASISHELNQPLNAILHNAAAAELLLMSDRATVSELRDILADIRDDDARASHIILRQRAMLKPRPPDQRPLDLNAVVRESLAIVANDALARQVRFETDLSPSPCAITGDHTMLRQAVLILVLNAMDAMARTPVSRRSVIVRSALAGGLAEVSVHDCGEGIAADVASRLFEPFVTTKDAGMGVGLAIVRRVVETHRGTISATNNPGGGATFRFTVPLAAADGASGVVAAGPSAPHRTSVQVASAS
jgi:signal transduction histidine kinase